MINKHIKQTNKWCNKQEKIVVNHEYLLSNCLNSYNYAIVETTSRSQTSNTVLVAVRTPTGVEA